MTPYRCVWIAFPVMMVGMLSWNGPLRAQGAAEEPVPEFDDFEQLYLGALLEQEVQSATLTSQRIPEAPSIVSVLRAEQFRALGLTTLRDALQRMAGATVLFTQSGGKQVALRGVSSNPANVLVLLDGQPLNSFYNGSFLEDIALDDIERIELVRGPGSALYGTNAYAGVISLFTRKDSVLKRVGLALDAHVDDETTLGVRPSLAYAGRLAGFDLFLQAGYYRTDGQRVEVSQDVAGDPSFSRVPGYTNGHQELASVLLRVGRDGLLRDGDQLTAESMFFYRDLGPFFGFKRVFTPDSDLSRWLSATFLEYALPLPRSLSLRSRVSFEVQDMNNRIREQPRGYFSDVDSSGSIEENEVFPEGRRREVHLQENRLALRAHLSHQAGSWRLVNGNQLLVGLECEYDWLPLFEYGQNWKSDFFAPGPLSNHDGVALTQRDKGRTIVAGILQDQLELVGRLSFTVGLRYDVHSDFGNSLSPRAAIVWRALPKLAVKLLYGQAFRAPTFQELYDQTSPDYLDRPVRGNENLDPETTRTVELGVDVTPIESLSLRASGFYVKNANTIELSSTYSVAGRTFVNYPDREILGFESEVAFFWSRDSYLAANVTWFQSEQLGVGMPGWEENNDRKFVDKVLTDLPRIRANASLSAKLPADLRLGLSYSYVGESENNKRSMMETLTVFRRPAFHEVLANLTLSLWKQKLDLTLGAEYAHNEIVPIMIQNDEQVELPARSVLIFLGSKLYL